MAIALGMVLFVLLTNVDAIRLKPEEQDSDTTEEVGPGIRMWVRGNREQRKQAVKDLQLAQLSHKLLPSWCSEPGSPTGGQDLPREATLRARALAKIARLNPDTFIQPADPTEWACSHPWSAWFLYGIVYWAAVSMAAFMAASFWIRGDVPKFDDQSLANPEETFLHGHFSCLSDRQTCVSTIFCPAVRWANNLHAAGLMSFWIAFCLLTACFLPTIFLLTSLFVVVPLTYSRQRLRDKLGLPSGNETYATDCCFALWCPCCLIAQEARVINEAYATGHMAMPVSGGRYD